MKNTGLFGAGADSVAFASAPSPRRLSDAALKAGFLASGLSTSAPSRAGSGRHNGLCGFVPGYSGGAAPDFHRLPFSAVFSILNRHLNAYLIVEEDSIRPSNRVKRIPAGSDLAFPVA